MRTLVEAAHELGLTYQAAHRLVLSRKLHGEKRGKHWWVTEASIRKYAREQQR